jgi:hypothetical protein
VVLRTTWLFSLSKASTPENPEKNFRYVLFGNFWGTKMEFHILIGVLFGICSRFVMKNHVVRLIFASFYPLLMKLSMDWVVPNNIYYQHPELLDVVSKLVWYIYLIMSPLLIFRVVTFPSIFHVAIVNYFILSHQTSPIADFLILLAAIHVPLRWLPTTLVSILIKL